MKKAMAVGYLIALTLGACATAPPPVNGNWDVQLTAPEGQTGFTMSVVVDGENATATTGQYTFDGTFRDGKLKLKGDYYVAEAGYSAPLDMDIQLEDDKLTGSATWDQYSADVDANRAE